MEIIRGRLSAADFSPPNLRYNVGTDTVQFTPDDGTTWVDAPSADPRHSDLYRLPPLTTTDARCDAAANMVKWMKDFIDRITELLEAGATAFTLINTALELMSAIFNPSILVLAITEVCETLFGIGSAALLAAFTSDQYDLLLCCFYCNIEPDGSCTPAELVDIETQVTADLNGIASLVVNLIFTIQGEVGVSNAGVVGGQTGDCADCACRWCLKFTPAHGLGDWFVNPTTGGIWNGTVWTPSNNWINIEYSLTLAAGSILDNVQFTWNDTTTPAAVGVAVDYPTYDNICTFGCGSPQSLTLPDLTEDTFTLAVWLQAPTAAGQISEIRIGGIGTPPEIDADPC